MYSVPNDIKIGPFVRPDTNIMSSKKPTVGSLPYYPHTTNLITPGTMKQNILIHQNSEKHLYGPNHNPISTTSVYLPQKLTLHTSPPAGSSL
jgi:hypothetical protein